MRNENIGTANIKVLEVEQIDVQDGTIEKYVGIDSNGAVVKSTSGGGGGAGLVDGDYGDVVVSGVGTVMTIDDLAVTTAKIADSGVALAKLDATGAAAGKVLTTDGTAMTWETPAGGGLTLPIDEIYGGADGTTAMKLQVVGGANPTPSYITAIEANLNGGDGTYGNIALQVANLSGGDTHYPIIIKDGPKISSGAGGAYNEHNYFSVMGYNVHIGGNFGTTYLNILNGIKIDTTDNTIRIHNPADPAQYLDINYNGIPIGDGSVTETKLGDSSVTQAKISATGADVGKVLTTDGTTMTWETPYTAPTGTADNTTRFNASGQLVETNVITISDAADVIVTGETFDVSLNTGGSYIYMDSTSGYIQLENVDSYGGIYWRKNTTGATLSMDVDAEDSITSVDYRIKLDANTYTGNGSILVGEYDVAEDVPKWGFRNIADSFPVGTPAFNLLNTSSAPFATSKSYIDLIYTTYSKYTKLSANYFCLDLMPNFYNFTASYGGTSRSIIGFANNQMQTMPNLGFWIDTWNSSLGFVSKTMPSWMPNYFPGNAQTTNTRMSVDANTGRSIVMAAYADESAFTGYMYNNNDGTGWKAVYKTIDGSTSDRYGVINRVYVSGSNYLLYIHTSGGTKWFRTTNHITYTEIVGLTGGIMYETSQAGHLICYNVGATVWWYSANNGTTWTAGTTLPVTVSDGRNAIDFNGTQFVYASGTTANQVYYTTAVNGSWTTRAAGGATLQNTPDMVYWLNDRWIFLITGQSDTTTYGGYSTDIASNYSVGSVPSPGSNQFFWACYGGGSWYIITNNAYYHSADGINYTRVATTLVPTSPSMQHDVKKTHIYQQNDILTTAPYTTSSLIRLNLTTRVVSTIAANAQLTNCVQMADSTYTIGSKNLWVKYAM